jgi:uncharacterized damage-inducible protein DinB
MNEVNRHRKLFSELYNGDPWLDENLLKTLSSISAQVASRKLLPGCNTIWEITNHLVSWRKNILERINGNIIPTPPDNYFIPV